MKSHILMASMIIVSLAVFTAPTASAACNISDTKCAVNGGKCNIKFRNRTGDSSGSDGSSDLNQTYSAQTVIVKARKSNGNKAGNKLTIAAGASKTMNMDKKANKDFQEIQISSQDFGDSVSKVTMSCQDVKAVLNGNGTCKVFFGLRNVSKGGFNFYLGYQCDSGNVGGPN